MSDLDLDIQHYSISNMEAFFRLNNTTKYSPKDIELREYEIREQLLSSGHINKKLKRDLIDFLNKVKLTLIEVKCPTSSSSSLFPQPKKPLDPTPNYPTNIQYPPSNVRENEIQHRNSVPFVYTQNSDYLPGILNPIQTRTITRCISIDTRFRDYIYTTQSSDFALNIPNKIQKVVSIQLNAIEFSPDALYNISEKLQNNYLNVNIHTYSYEEYNHCFIIPDGKYTSEQLIFILNKLFLEKINTPFNSLFLKLDPYGSGKTIFNTTTKNIVQFVSFDFTLNMDGLSDKNTTDYFCKLGRVLGFTKRKYSGQNTYTSETAVNTNIAFSYLFLAIDDFQNNSPSSFISVFQKNTISNSVLARIQLNSSSSSSSSSDISFISEPRKYFGPIDITKLQIKLLDAYGRVLDMNGSDYSFCLLLHLIYDF
jgi:hypothetical protein